ncbi:MAG TPA: DUF805 domain-containing protein [Gaiellales bacterium]|nr:DUF805 domain-containing protein [Gaiellales bacterium]
MHWYTDVIRQYAVFDGRATRPQYWWFALINAVISLVLRLAIPGAGLIISELYGLAVLLPSIGVAIRRLHDTNRTGWWILVVLIPVVGWVWLIVLLARPGDTGPNQYGPPPGSGNGEPVIADGGV